MQALSGWLGIDVARLSFAPRSAAGPSSVSISSISSIVSQNGTIAWARPPVAMHVGSPPSSRSIRRAIAVDQPGEAEDHARLDRAAGRLADRRRRARPSSIRGIRAPRSVSAVSEISTPGAIAPPRYSPVGGDGVEVDPGAEVDHDAGAAEALVGGDGVDEPVGADLVAGCRSGSASRS